MMLHKYLPIGGRGTNGGPKSSLTQREGGKTESKISMSPLLLSSLNEISGHDSLLEYLPRIWEGGAVYTFRRLLRLPPPPPPNAPSSYNCNKPVALSP